MQNVLLVAVIALIGVAGFMFLTNSGSDVAPETDMETTTSGADTTEMMAGEAADAMEERVTPNNADIVATAIATPELSTLVSAVTAGGLVETLQGDGPFTVFAPTNSAFAALPAGTLDTLLLPENVADLQGILTYHVVPGIVVADDLSDGMTVETVSGETITINVAADGTVSINGVATVVAADVTTANGVVHVIDSVLLPPAVQ
jgi:uncharacterized surface protein with fasciclin (FAS1) repeats